jgi:outer membrane protein TolC
MMHKVSTILVVLFITFFASVAFSRGVTEPKHFETLKVSEQTLMSLSEVNRDFQDWFDGRQLTLADLMQRVASSNREVLLKEVEWQIRQAEAAEAQSIFEPELNSTVERVSNEQQNSLEESLSQNLESTYSEDNWTHDTSIQALVPSGGTIQLGYSVNRYENSLYELYDSLRTSDHEYQAYFGINLVQPLLRGAGSKVTRSGILSADLESSAAFQTYRLNLMQRVSETAIDYWDYYQAVKKFKLREKSYRIAQDLLHDNRERYRAGKISETEVLEAEVGVNNRRSLLSKTEHEMTKMANRLRTLLAITEGEPALREKGAGGTSMNPLAGAPRPVSTRHILDSRDDMLFAYGESTLTEAMGRTLLDLTKNLNSRTIAGIRVIGHTDSDRLSAEKVLLYRDNVGLGLARARAVAATLAEQLDIDADSIDVSSMGAASPVAPNDSSANRDKNRRVEIIISYTSEQPTHALLEPLPPTPLPLNLAFSDPGTIDFRSLDPSHLKEAALSLRPEYLAVKKKLEQADIKILYAKNQLWPQLDLTASYGWNGLDSTVGDAWSQLSDGHYETWSAGIELSIPLQGNKKNRSKLKQTQLEKRRQLIRLKNLETELSNRIDTACVNIKTSTEQLQYAHQISAIQKKLFEIEQVRLEAGQSSSQSVLEKEENYRNSEEEALVGLINQQRALIEMELASGNILQNYNIDIQEPDR